MKLGERDITPDISGNNIFTIRLTGIYKNNTLTFPKVGKKWLFAS